MVPMPRPWQRRGRTKIPTRFSRSHTVELQPHATAPQPCAKALQPHAIAFARTEHAAPIRPEARLQLHAIPFARTEYAAPYGPKDGTNELEEGVFEVKLEKPCGIGFEELGPIPGSYGVSVNLLVPDGNGARSGKIEVGDLLVGVTAVVVNGAKFERQMLDCRRTHAHVHFLRPHPRPHPRTVHRLAVWLLSEARSARLGCRRWPFDRVVDAIGSNEPKFGCEDVILQFERPAPESATAAPESTTAAPESATAAPE